MQTLGRAFVNQVELTALGEIAFIESQALLHHSHSQLWKESGQVD